MTSSASERSTAVADPGKVEWRLGVKQLPPDARPRERLLRHGAGALSDVELLANIIQTGQKGIDILTMCQRLVSEHGGALGLDRATPRELEQVRGIGAATVAQIKAALELGRRAVSVNPESAVRVRSPEDLWNLTRAELVALEREELRVVVLDTKNTVRGVHALYKGTLNATTVRMAELFRDAVRANAAAIALVHNHPSGDPTPSPQDVQLTRDAVQAGKQLDVEVVDHIVVGRSEPYYVSLRERGLGFSRNGT